MANQDGRSRLRNLDARLKAARARRPDDSKNSSIASSYAASGMGVGVKVAVDLVAGVGVGAGIGWGLDWWLGTKPWLLGLFCILGFIAGLLNVIRTANRATQRPHVDDQVDSDQPGSGKQDQNE